MAQLAMTYQGDVYFLYQGDGWYWQGTATTRFIGYFETEQEAIRWVRDRRCTVR